MLYGVHALGMILSIAYATGLSPSTHYQLGNGLTAKYIHAHMLCSSLLISYIQHNLHKISFINICYIHIVGIQKNIIIYK